MSTLSDNGPVNQVLSQIALEAPTESVTAHNLSWPGLGLQLCDVGLHGLHFGLHHLHLAHHVLHGCARAQVIGRAPRIPIGVGLAKHPERTEH